MDDKLVIDVSRLENNHEKFSGELDSACLEMDGEKWIHPFATLRYDIEVQLFGKELLVRGTLEQDFAAVCSRCGIDFDFTCKVPDFTVSAEISPETEYFDLTNDVRECILLTLPAYPVCREDCRGICPRCRKNLNEGDCGCKDEETDTRWSALNNFAADMEQA